MAIIDFDKNKNAYFDDLKNLKISNETKEILEKDLSLSKFIKRVLALCKLKS